MAKKRQLGMLQGKRQIKGNEVLIEDHPESAWMEKEADYHRQVLAKIREGLATKVLILASHDSCPVCQAYDGAYQFDDVPELPIEGCSHPHGCRCHYAPVLDLFGP